MPFATFIYFGTKPLCVPTHPDGLNPSRISGILLFLHLSIGTDVTSKPLSQMFLLKTLHVNRCRAKYTEVKN